MNCNPKKRIFLDFQISPIIAAFLYPLCLSIGTVLDKWILKTTQPLSLMAIELVASTTFLWLMVIIRGCYVPFRWETIQGGVVGIFDPGIARTLFILGLSSTTASCASLIGAVEPIIAMVLSYLFLRERISSRLIFFAIIALFGVILVMELLPGEIQSGSISGNLLVLSGTIVAASYTIFSKRTLTTLSPLLLSTLQQSAGLLCFLVIFTGYKLLKRAEVYSFSLNLVTITYASLVGIIQYGLSFWLFLIVLQSAKASVTPLYINLVPIFTIAGAYFLIGEHLSKLQLFGTVLVMSNIIYISWFDKKR
jgi:drug/metabolite transporter (DMT)-like permease